MTQKSNKPDSLPARQSALGRQIVFSAIALGIIGLGAWSMWGQNAPYHPQIVPEDVTRGDATGINGLSTGN